MQPVHGNSQDQFENWLSPQINYLVYRKCTPAWNLLPHIVNNCDITYIIKGKARYTINNIIHEVSEGNIICLSSGDLKSAITYPHSLMQCFTTNFSLLDDKAKPVDLPFSAVSNIGLQKDILQYFHEMTYTWMDRKPGYIIKVKGLLFFILHRLYELTIPGANSSIMDFRVRKSIQYVIKNYPNKITVKKLADLLELNVAYFGELFKKETGLTVNQYLIRTRIRYAIDMLKSGSYTVNEVAESTGFSDIYHFYKRFKNLTGISPSKYIPKNVNNSLLPPSPPQIRHY
jgi:AraC-like DNA-binding protein